jgi:DNA-binding NtrC family response regulator
MNIEKKKILIVDDDEHICATLNLILEARGYAVEIANTGKEAMEKAETSYYNLAILDIRLPDIEGTELLRTMRQVSPKMVKIMLTGYPQLDNAIKSLNDGADAYFTKPVEVEKLLDAIEEKLDEQNIDKSKTEKELGLFLRNRAEKFKQELKEH